MITKVVRLTREEALVYVEKGNRCGGCEGCSKYDARPCCPPRIRNFRKFTPKKYLYLVMAKMTRDEAPETIRSAFYWMCYGHQKTRTRVNRIVKKFPGFRFTVGGCARCSYKLTGVCNEVLPALEAVGFRVDRIAEEQFGTELQWYTKEYKVEPEYYVAIAGLYTDEVYPKARFME